jgi:predicted PurR-regulated permease PerM
MTVKKPPAPIFERLSLILVGIVAFGFLVVQGKQVLDPLLFGFLFAILLLPVSNFFEKRLRLPRSAASFISIILLVSFVSGVLYLVGSQISNLMHDWPMLKNQVFQSVSILSDWIQATFHLNMQKQESYVQNTAKKIMSSGTEVITTTFGAVSSLFLFYVFIMIFTFFTLFYRRLILKFILQAFGRDNELVVHDIVEKIQGILRQYILGLMLEMIIVACVACTAFWMIGIQYAVLLGIIVGLFNIIPYLGIFTALVLSVLITFATGPVSNAVWVGASVVVIHAVDANFLLPTVVGSQVRLNALITFLGIILGEMMWGLSGMFLSIPVMGILKIIFDRVEGLKHWGYLLGGDYEYKKPAEKKMKTE